MSGRRYTYSLSETTEEPPRASTRPPAVDTTESMDADAIETALTLAAVRGIAIRAAFDASALEARAALAEARRTCASARALLAESRRGR